MKKLTKKGQTEDFLADLIPSAIIILIGLYVLSNMQDANRLSATEKERAINTALKFEQTTVLDYLSLKVDVDDKKMTMQELISLTYKDEGYQRKLREWLLRKDLAQQEILWEFIAKSVEQEYPEEISKGRKACLELKIQYPNGSSLEVGEKCDGREQTFYLPTFDGQYLEIKSIVGTTKA